MKFSSYEIRELLKAWIAVSIAFAILFTGFQELLTSRFLFFFVISALTVGIGFLLHELAHKMLAQRYGCWAEFRSDNRMLIFMIAVSFLGFVFAAPGAVIIHGYVDRRKNGLISVVGPATNLILALLFLLFSSLAGESLGTLFRYGFTINAWLGLFNMLPFWNFDGAKVFAWDKGVFGAVAGIAAVMVFFASII